MYQAESARLLVRGRTESGSGQRLRVSRNVVLLGLTSLLTDVSSEMVAAVLPIYAVVALGATPLQYGFIDGIYQGASAIVRVGSGILADRWSRYKELAGAGYGLSTACRAAMLAVGGTVTGLSAVVLADRIGKGIRTAPRDALISLSSAPDRLGVSFGVHRAMDTAGAMLGPLVAFLILLAAPGQFDAVFAVSFCFALLGLAVLVLFVQNRRRREPAAPTRRAGVLTALALLKERRYRTLVLVGGALSLLTISDGFLYLGLQRRLDLDNALFPLLFVGGALSFMLLAIPVGRLADRTGRARVFVGGYALLLMVYAALLLPDLTAPVLALVLFLLGAYYAATDGVLMAAASAVLPEERRGSGLGLLVTATSLGKFAAALLFGLLWTMSSLGTAALAFAALLAVVLCAAVAVVGRIGWSALDA